MSVKGFYINGSVQKYDYKSLANIPDDTGLTEQAKRALLACFEQVAWTAADGRSYYDALEEALYPQGYVGVTNNLTGCRSTNEATTAAVGKPYTATIIADNGCSLTGAEVSITMGGTSVTGYYSNGAISIPNVTGDIIITVTAASAVSSISADFTQGSANIYNTDSLDTLRQYLTVTAYYIDTTSATVNDYELSGTLTDGSSTITVSYGGKTDTFSVTVKYLPSGYIKDGLMFFLDGKRGASANQWTDLVGDKTFELTNCTLDSNGGVVFDGTAYGAYQGQVSNDWANETIEVVFDGISSIRTKTILYQPTVNATTGISLRFGDDGTKVRFCYCPDGVTREFPTENISASKNRASLTAETLVLNQTKATTTATTAYSANQTGITYLGAQKFTEAGNISGLYIGKILAVRIYNRKLTQAEMVANQQNDVSYYGL